ncbi:MULTISPECIES: glycoside hydrolase family 3 protein [unclassified Leucobacter]|uniref:glycoside hydrolase family 3 protein n=1 Tax=unclassified Leucobacter TaxID=2621730 RepID=UPI000621C38C|nr:glycoside hydrolase family 3 N-terminal domain-containing protein [Leucobacter sp. Ag1]KKI22197.1 beta-glucosidase [Leucobacter sp. Ag1]
MTTPENETRFPYQDASLSVEQRVEDLLVRMELADKAGMLFHTMVGYGDPSEGNSAFGIPSAESMVRKRRMTHFNLLGAAPDGREFAAWHNALQRMALDTGLGIPITFSTDPRHAFSDNPLTSMMAGPFSQWPETLGFAALGSPDRLERFADIARQEYLAVGLRVALHPQIDLATEPRWSRISGTFGEDADLTSRLVVGYIRGLQGEALGTESVAAMVKHFPGGGPQLDGEDPHFAWGREQVYPGGAQEYHLQPFIAAIDAGATQMMPYYGMPVGTDWEEVGFGFNKGVLTDLLRDRLGFEGIVCTDWGLLTDVQIFGADMPARAWGIEHLSRPERMLKAIDAGVDQFGGELCTEVLIDLVREGRVAEDRIDASVRRLLREKFRMGLFDSPFVDEDHAEAIVGRADFVEEGLATQSDSLTLLTNTDRILPLQRGIRVYAEGVAPEALAAWATAVETPEEADVAILRVKAPYEERDRGGFSALFHSGSLEFPAEEHARLTGIAETVPTVLDVYLDRPAVLGGLEESARAALVDYGARDEAVLAVLFGDRGPQGALPFDLPRSDAAVIASRSDVAFDTENPTFRFGHGLRY